MMAADLGTREDGGTRELVDRLLSTRRLAEVASIELIGIETAYPAEAAAETIVQGWQRGSYPRISLSAPVDWDGAAPDRSSTYWLHAWEFMAPILVTHGDTRDRAMLDYCLALAADWIEQFPERDTSSTFAWYDMAVGFRAFRLAYLIDAALHEQDLGASLLVPLVDSLRLHLSVLADDEEFREHSNHGIYQAVGQRAAARRFPELPEAPEALLQSSDRLRRLIQAHFGDDGVHREHSPAYHLMVLRTLLRMQSSGLIDEAETSARLRTAEESMAWFIAPVGTVPMVGDSDRAKENRTLDSHVSAPELSFALTEGAVGAPPPARLRVFPEAGYAVARDRWAVGRAFVESSYFLQNCAFHSRVHKHADDLSFVWYGHGYDLLADAGRFGYVGRVDPASDLGLAGFYYSDPSRIYVESTRAHNCLEIDGQSYPRRRVKPYGSALISASSDEDSGLLATHAAATHFRTVRHTRFLFHVPGQFVLVVDHAIDKRVSDAHDYVQRFLFGPDLETLSSHGSSVVLEIPNSGRSLVAINLDDAQLVPPVRGATEPRTLGFVSRRPSELLPCWTVGWTRERSRQARLATLILITTHEEAGAVTPAAHINATGRAGKVGWTSGGLEHTLKWSTGVDPERGEQLEASYATT